MTRKVKKFLKIVGCVVGTLLLLIVLTLLFWLGPTIKLVAQVIGPKALGSDVQIERLRINPIKGTISLSDFTIKNPDVFGQSNAVSLASLDISVDMASLFSSTIIVHQVEINSPYFIYEQDLQSDNITEFIRNVQAFAKIDPNAPPKPKKEKKDSGKPAPIVIVESLAINDVQFNLANTHDDKLDIGVGFESLTVSMTNGTVFLDNVYVRNPKRLETKNLFTLDGIHIEMDPGSIYSTNIHFKSIDVLNPHAFIEHNPKTDTVGEFLKIASSLVAKIPTNAPKAQITQTTDIAETEKPPAAPSPEITLDRLVIDDVQIHAVSIGSPDLDIMLGMNYFSVELEDGKISMDQLYLSNPARLSTPNVFSLEHFAVQLEPGSHKKDTLVIKDVQVDKPHTFLELNTNCNTVSEFLRLANGYIERIPTYEIPALPPAPEKSIDPKAEQATASTYAAPPFELHNLVIDDVFLYLLDRTDTNYPSHTPRLIAGIDDISCKLTEGSVAINDILVPNSPGFMASNIFHLAKIAVAIDPDTIFSDQVMINEIFIDSPRIDLEQTETSGNVSELQMALMQFAPTPDQLPKFPAKKSETAKADHPETTRTPTPLAEQPVVLHQVTLTNLAVNLVLPVTTNQTDGIMQSLNPMDSVSLSKLMPNKDDTEDTEPVSDKPLPLIAFRKLSLEPLKGSLHIDHMQVANPPGFSQQNLVQFEHFRINLDPDSIQTDTIHIKDILIQKPKVRYERQITTDNIKALELEIENATMRRQKEMEKVHEIPESAETNVVQAGASTNTVAKAEQKIIIDRIFIPDGIVRAKLSALPAIPVPLPDIEIKDLGKEEGGTSLADAHKRIFNTVYDSIIGAVGNTTGFATDALKGIGGLTANALGGVSDGIGKAAKNTADAAEETIEKSKRRRRGAGGRR